MGKEVEDILLEKSSDRRLLNYVPAEDGVRTNLDRRQIAEDASAASETTEAYEKMEDSIYEGIRYAVDYPVTVTCRAGGRKKVFQAKAVNLSGSGVLLKMFKEDGQTINKADDIQLKFEILAGSMPEGYEMPVNIRAEVTRNFAEVDGYVRCGLHFKETLAEYSNKHRGRYMFMISAFWLFMVSLIVVLMRSALVK